MTNTIRKLVAVSIGLVPLSLAAPALADEPCSPLDLTCVVDDVVERGGDVVDDVPDPVGDTTDPVVRAVLDRVHDVLNGGDPADPPGGHGTGDGDHSGRPGSGAAGRPQHRNDGRGPDVAPSAAAHPRSPHQLRTVPTSSVLRRAAGPRPAAERQTGLGPAAVAVARSLAVVGVLFGISLGFLLIQQRLDRNDPKLAEAPLEPETVPFA